MAEEAEDQPEAGSRTEAPTPRRLERARQEGNAPLSREAVGFATLLCATIASVLVLPGALGDGLALLRGAIAHAGSAAPAAAAREALLLALGALWPVLAAAAAAAVAATLAQTRGAIAPKLLAPRLSRLDPLAGLRRKFGAEGWIEFTRSLLKLVAVGAALAWVAIDLPRLAAALQQGPGGLVAAAAEGAEKLLFATLGVFALLAAADVLLVRFRWIAQLRMTRQELREELKETEGDPVVKARQRSIRETRGRQRMLAAVPTATVVVTNPTHYAVALRYDPAAAAAPRVVAKGVDALAARIREAAEAHGVPIHRDPPLARALYRLEVDTEIPPEHWEAVARIIAFVLRARGTLPG
ncbi:MAG: EscU/YscU/HrcU family type III secretion system export apparatus switch protein [Rhodovarius sp.]|nr:EscU/YscU/HrcU family type III secretion system export apparatus switch protein [Rhodovarius sp.]